MDSCFQTGLGAQTQKIWPTKRTNTKTKAAATNISRFRWYGLGSIRMMENSIDNRANLIPRDVRPWLLDPALMSSPDYSIERWWQHIIRCDFGGFWHLGWINSKILGHDPAKTREIPLSVSMKIPAMWRAKDNIEINADASSHHNLCRRKKRRNVVVTRAINPPATAETTGMSPPHSKGDQELTL